MDEDTIRCPKCGQINPNTDTCLSCGIIFAKYQKNQIQIATVMTHEPVPKRKKSKKGYILVFLAILSSGLVYWWFFTPDVKVYVEGIYTENEVQAHIYADVYVSCLKGFGVQLIYHPNQLTVESTEEIDDFLYTPMKIINRYQNSFEVTQYDLPDTTTPFESIFFVGYKPEDDCGKATGCQACISDKRVLIGKVTFSRVENKMPFDPSYLFITFASGNNTSDHLRDFDKDIGRTSMRTGSSNVRLDGKDVKFGPITIKEAS